MKKKLGVVAAGLAVIALVFWLKVEHAVGVCADAGGRWADGDCLFDEHEQRH